jgi:hypothetical protein
MPTYLWLVIIGLILVIWWIWSQYGALYTAVQDNPAAIKAGQSISRYATDIQGLIGAYQSANDTEGNFMSRLGAFVGALPT